LPENGVPKLELGNENANENAKRELTLRLKNACSLDNPPIAAYIG
jgi:hypothetical protein